MTANPTGPCSVSLEGSWFMEQAAQLKELLTENLTRLSAEMTAGSQRVEIDLSGIADLDSCCCQLLAVFLVNLRRRGLAPVTCGLAPQLSDKIAQLGFSEAFAEPSIAGKESA